LFTLNSHKKRKNKRGAEALCLLVSTVCFWNHLWRGAVPGRRLPEGCTELCSSYSNSITQLRRDLGSSPVQPLAQGRVSCELWVGY